MQHVKAQFHKGIVDYSLLVRLDPKTTLRNMKRFGYVCFASEAISSVSLVSESTFRNPFFRDPCLWNPLFRNPIFFGIHLFGIHFLGTHLFRDPFLRSPCFRNWFFGIHSFGIHFFGIHFSEFIHSEFIFGTWAKTRKMRISENGRVSFLCGNGEDFGVDEEEVVFERVDQITRVRLKEEVSITSLVLFVLAAPCLWRFGMTDWMNAVQDRRFSSGRKRAYTIRVDAMWLPCSSPLQPCRPF